MHKKLAHRTGVEPVTYRLESGCSIQLSYRCAYDFINAGDRSAKFKQNNTSCQEIDNLSD